MYQKISLMAAVIFVFSCDAILTSNGDEQGENTKFTSGAPPKGNSSDEYRPPDEYTDSGDNTANGDSLGNTVDVPDEEKEDLPPSTGDKPGAPGSINPKDKDYNKFYRDVDDPDSGCHLTEKKLESDFINFPWPPEIKACYEAGNLYDFYNKKCATIASPATKFECNWTDAQLAMLNRVYKVDGLDEELFAQEDDAGARYRELWALYMNLSKVKISSNALSADELSTLHDVDRDKLFEDGAYTAELEALVDKSGYEGQVLIGEKERNEYAKIVGCGEHTDDDYDMIILQYWYPTKDDRTSCKVDSNWHIFTSCRYFCKDCAKGMDLTWGDCLQFQ